MEMRHFLAHNMEMRHFLAHNSQFAQMKSFFEKIINTILIYLLARFILQNLQKISRADL